MNDSPRALEIQVANRMGTVDRGGCLGFKELPRRKRSNLLHQVYRMRAEPRGIDGGITEAVHHFVLVSPWHLGSLFSSVRSGSNHGSRRLCATRLNRHPEHPEQIPEMPVQPTETCENCPSKECQKAHWEAHKPYYVFNVEIAKRADDLGADYSDRLKAIGKCAFDIMNHLEHIDASPFPSFFPLIYVYGAVLVIYLEFLGPSKPPHTHAIVDAAALLRLRAPPPLRPVHLPIPALTVKRNLAPRPGVIRVLLLNRALPCAFLEAALGMESGLSSSEAVLAVTSSH
ncbi:hypothetical protein DFH09DRAFT_1312758 [Mycena vulgaris]|nr:hypothetical protein DFH09DRAFT_1312758 [Mycena vulgaris]